MERKIRQNEFVYGMQEPRVDEYKIFCAYLTHVIMGYKLGQEGGDSEDKETILDLIAEQSSHCFPGWKQMIVQSYGKISREEESKDVTIRERVLARLQAERRHILSVRMLQLGEIDNIHEPNFLLDMFREELGTQLEPINDPHTQQPWYIQQYGKTKEQLRKDFDEYYNKNFIVATITEHINEQQERMRESKVMLDLPPMQVIEWLKERCASSWKQREYDSIISTVKSMQMNSKTEEKIDNYLKTYGIERRKEEKVEEAIIKLKNEIARMTNNFFIQTNDSLKSKISEIYKIQDNGKRTIEKQEFLELNPKIIANANSSKEQLERAVDQFIIDKKKERKELETLLAIVESVQDKDQQKEILKGKGRIKPAQALEEVLTLKEIKEAQIDKFFEEVVYEEVAVGKTTKTMFTPEATALFLKSMGILS